MNSFPQISIIVPVYNAEKYLTQCIDSILAQDFTDFELLLIDDGSKDKSGLICDEYAQKDKRIRVFHKENSGVSSTRNLGIDKAQGVYITFIDSDDYVDSNYLSILTSVTADLIVTGYKKNGTGREQGFGAMKKEYSFDDALYDEHQIPQCLSYILDDTPMRSPWDKLFKRKIIKEYSIYFDSSIRNSEDAVFVQTYLLHCHTIASRSGIPYHYRIEPDNDTCFKYSLSSNEYLYTLHMTLQAYEKVSRHFNFTCDNYFQATNKLMLMLYYRHISKNHFSFQGYTDYKHTMKKRCPQVNFSDILYSISYKLVRKKMYFLSYFILSFIYPLKLYLRK